MKILRQSVNGIRHLVFANTCPGCQRSLFYYEKNICKICWTNLPLMKITDDSHPILLNRLAGRVNLNQAYAMMRFYQGGISQKLLHAIKYQGAKNLAFELGEKFGNLLEGNLKISKDTILVPVPLHPFKLQIRSFNQSEQIALGISKILNIPVLSNALERQVFHVSQTQKRKEARWEEIKNDFFANDSEVSQRDIILVDDVCTSGATIEACANALNNKNVKSISLLTLSVAGDNYQ